MSISTSIRAISKNSILPATISVLLTTVSHSAMANQYAYSPQDILNGDSSIIATAGYGKGIVFGDIDTGIAPSIWFNPTYNQQGLENISTTAGVCLNTFTVAQCRTVNPLTMPTDQNSHGTFTASEMVGGLPAYGYNSMAPAGTVLSVQVLNAQGSGNSTDVANGITYAVNHGAQVLNLSLGPSGTPAQQAAFYQSLAPAINSAAAKGIYVVFAAGNSNQPFSNGATITGFTDAAIQHMLIMGSTRVGNGVNPTTTTLSSFSDSAGSGKFISTTGNSYNIGNMFLVADGENIVGASNANGYVRTSSGFVNCSGYSCIQSDSGTSMAAPQGTAAIGLLEKVWPILATNGKAAQALEATGVDVGVTGVDSTYGSGYLNLAAAFQPVGGTYAVTSGGTVSIAQNSSNSTLSGGALGSLPGVTSHLANYAVFDSLERNFTVNLSGLVATKPSLSSATMATMAPSNSIQSVHFADGSNLAFGDSQNESAVAVRPSGTPANVNRFVSFTDASGSTIAAGSGFPASASFADALWGQGSAASSETSALGVSNALMNLAEGGQFVAFGTPVNTNTRVALSWTQSQAAMDPITASDWTMPNASAFNAGITSRLADGWTGGVTFGALNEQNALLGTTYVPAGPLGFGDQHRSMSFGLTSAFDLGDKRGLMIDAAVARVDGAALSNSLITDVSPVYARSLGAAFTQQDALNEGDNVSLSLRAPLMVFSGSASLAMASVDDNGNPVISNQHVSLKPNGSEVDFAAGYQAPISDNLQWNVTLEERHDADNIAGLNDIAGRIGAKLNF